MDNLKTVINFIFWITVLMHIFPAVLCLSPKPLSDEEMLMDYLFSVYNPSARPVLNSSETVNVKIQFSLLQIQELNVRNQVLTTTGLLILDWHDERLTWTPEISHLDELVIDGKGIWKPEFAVINGAEGIYEDYGNFQAVLRPNGHIHWEPGGVFKTMCTIDITYYPFDSQKCNLQFGAWSYYTSKMNLTTDVVEIRLDTYKPNGEWHILKTEVNRDEFAFDCCPDQRFSFVLFSIFMRRRHTFYIMNVILPGIMTSAVLLSIFFCTPSQKVHIGVASLLSFRLFLLNVADTIPRTSDNVPLLGIYLTCTMAITTLAMVATVFVLNLYAMKDRPVPKWIKTVFVVYLAKVLCICNCTGAQPSNNTNSNRGSITLKNKHSVGNHGISSDSDDAVYDSEAFYETQTQYGATGSCNHHRASVQNQPNLTQHQSKHEVEDETSTAVLSSPDKGATSRQPVRTGNRGVKYRLITTQDNKHILEEETDTDEGSLMMDFGETYHDTPSHQSVLTGSTEVWVKANDTPTATPSISNRAHPQTSALLLRNSPIKRLTESDSSPHHQSSDATFSFSTTSKLPAVTSSNSRVNPSDSDVVSSLSQSHPNSQQPTSLDNYNKKSNVNTNYYCPHHQSTKDNFPQQQFHNDCASHHHHGNVAASVINGYDFNDDTEDQMQDMCNTNNVENANDEETELVNLGDDVNNEQNSNIQQCDDNDNDLEDENKQYHLDKSNESPMTPNSSCKHVHHRRKGSQNYHSSSQRRKPRTGDNRYHNIQEMRRNTYIRAKSISAAATKPDYSADWVHVAAVCDRLFFWLCFIFIVFTTMLLFHPLTTSRYFKIPVIEEEEQIIASQKEAPVIMEEMSGSQ